MRLGIWTPAPISIRPDETILDAFHGLGRNGGNGPDPAHRFAVDTIKRAEELGFEVTLIAERYYGEDIEAWLMSASLAEATSTIEIMTAVHPGILSPQLAAKMGASMDRISGGRASINVVNGARKPEFDLYGEWLDMEAPRYRRMEEFLQVMKACWTEEDVSFKGEFYEVDHGRQFLRPQQVPYPKLYAASRTQEGMDVVARHCDTWFCSYHLDFRRFEESIDRIAGDIQGMERRIAGRGRPMGYGISALVIMGDTEQEAIAKAEEYEAYCRASTFTKTPVVALGAGLVGTRETIIERIRRYEDMGINLLMLHFWPMREGLEAFAREIMPEISKARVAAE
jgi:FMNH2-dependent dimethyl sulfone monooxygenase